MALNLDPLMKPPTSTTRRRFTQTLAGTTASLMTIDFRDNLNAAEPSPAWPDFEFIIISDTHIGRNKTSAEKQWQKCATELRDARGDFILHLGDVVNQSSIEQYPIYKTIRDSIGKPVHEIPGNHDTPADFEQQLGISADRSFDHGGVRFVLFNNAHTDSHDGFITEQQITWLTVQFNSAAANDLRIVVCAHVPIHTNRPPDRAWYVKPENGQTAFYELVDHHRDRVLAILHGHFHNGIRGWDDRAPTHEIIMPSVIYNQDRSLAEKGVPGYNLDEFRPGYVLARFADAKLHLRYQVIGESDVQNPLIGKSLSLKGQARAN